MKRWLLAAAVGGVFTFSAWAQSQVLANQGRPGNQGSWPVTITGTGADGGTTSGGVVTVGAHGACTETTMNVGTTGTACPAAARGDRTSVIVQLVQTGETLTVTEDGVTAATATAGTAISSGGTLTDNLSGLVNMSCRCTAATCSVRVRECP
jgi:hypothetical protein